MLAEEELTEAMHAAASRFGPASTDLVTAGAERGRAIRHRRNTVRVLSASTAFVALAGAGAFTVHVLDARSTGTTATSTATRPVTATASAERSETPVTQLKIISVLRQLLPHYDATLADDELQFGSVKITDAEGSVLLEANVQPDMNSLESSLYPCSVRAPAGYLKPTDVAKCQDVAVPDGAHLEVLTESEPTSIGPLYFEAADYCTAQGLRIVLTEVNSTLNNGEGAPTRPGETLTTAELATMAQSPLWYAN